MSKEQLQTNNIELGGNNDELDDIYSTLDSSLVSLANDTVTPETLSEGVTAHDASGNEVVGVMPTSVVLYTEQTLTDDQKEQARNNIGAASDDALAALIQNLFTGGEISVVKSVQRGTITIATGKTSGTATINAVDTSKAVVLYTGEKIESQYALEDETQHITLILTNATTITASYQVAQSGVKIYVPFQVIEYY